MQKYFLIGFGVLLFYTCSLPDKNNLPNHIIDKDKMEKVIYDMHMAEGLVALKPMNVDSNTKHVLAFYKSIYTKHKITEADFKESIVYYSQNPELLDSVYESLIIRLTEFESAISK